MHKANFNPKDIYKSFLIKLYANISEYFQSFQQVIVFYSDRYHFIVSFLAWKKPMQLFPIFPPAFKCLKDPATAWICNLHQLTKWKWKITIDVKTCSTYSCAFSWSKLKFLQKLKPLTTSQNISTTTHHHPPPAKIYPPTPTTTHQQPKTFL